MDRAFRDDDSPTDEIRETLGWEDDEGTHELRRDDVDRYEDGIYLQQRRNR